MMALSSNLDAVIQRTTRLAAVRIPRALGAALEPREWKDDALASARATLTGLAGTGEEQYIEGFAASAYVTLRDGMLALGMGAPGSARPATRVQLNLPGSADKYDVELGLSADNPKAEEELEQAVTDWVEQEKNWDPDLDGPKNDATVYQKAQWILRLLQVPAGSLSRTPVQAGDMSELDARKSLLPRLADYLMARTRQSDGSQLDPLTARLWLNAVLATWGSLVRSGYRAKVVEALKKN